MSDGRRGRPERLSKLQKTILSELKYNKRANERNYLGCNYEELKREVAEKYNATACMGETKFIPLGFAVSFHNSILNLYAKTLVELNGKEDKKGICQIAINEFGEEKLNVGCRKDEEKCFNNKKKSRKQRFKYPSRYVERWLVEGGEVECKYKISLFECMAHYLNMSPTQFRRFGIIGDFAPETVEMLDRKEITLTNALKIAEKKRWNERKNALNLLCPTRPIRYQFVIRYS